MPSFQASITPSKRAAGRFVSRVRRALQKALAEEASKSGITQSDLARAIGVNRSVIHRELRGHADLTLGRIAELAWALGRRPTLELTQPTTPRGSNLSAATSVYGCAPINVGRTQTAATSDDRSGLSLALTRGP